MCKLTNVKNLQVNTILEQVLQTIMAMLCTADIDTADRVNASDIVEFLTYATWVIHYIYNTVLKT